MSNNKQSSVEVVFYEMYNIISFYAGNEQDALCENIKKLSEAMHKEEIIQAWKKGDGQFDEVADKMSLEYYNETFNNNER